MVLSRVGFMNRRSKLNSCHDPQLFHTRSLWQSTEALLISRCVDTGAQEEEGRKVLQDIRGVDDVEEELADIKAACEQAAQVENPWRTILKPSYRPQLVVALTATFFQQWTGINTCAPFLLNPEPRSWHVAACCLSGKR